MVLSDEIRALRDRVLGDLNSSYDYYTDTKIAWKIVHRSVAAGDTFSVENKSTGTVTTQNELAAKARGYVSQELAEATFQQFLSIFENFLFDLLCLWLKAYPQNLIGKTVEYKEVLDAPDKDSITLLVINKLLYEIFHDRPTAWFSYLEKKAKLGCPTDAEIERIAEAKASRDVLVHNRGIAGKTYELKAGKRTRYKDGERIDIPEHYHRETWELIRKVVADVSNAAIAKAP